MPVLRRWDDGMSEAEKERRRKRAREWARANRERKRANDRAWRRRNPEKVAAKNAVYQALLRGTLTRQPCEVCGHQNTHAHHDDYAKRLEVRWLCVRHHAEADVARRSLNAR